MIHDPDAPRLSLTSNALIQVMQKISGREKSELEYIDRKLTESGLRPVGGRGRGARMMTEMDAARFLIALSCTCKISEIHEDVRAISMLPITAARTTKDHPDPNLFAKVLREIKTFDGYLAWFINRVAAKGSNKRTVGAMCAMINFDRGHRGDFRAKILSYGNDFPLVISFGGDYQRFGSAITSQSTISGDMILALSRHLYGLDNVHYSPKKASVEDVPDLDDTPTP